MRIIHFMIFRIFHSLKAIILNIFDSIIIIDKSNEEEIKRIDKIIKSTREKFNSISPK